MKKIIWLAVTLLLLSDVLNAGELHEAAQKGDLRKVKLLLKSEANIDAMDDQGVTPLLWASTYGKAEVVKYLISKGADVNYSLQHGMTALMLATEYGENEVASILVNNGAKINVKEKSGYAALDLAVNKDNEIITALLIKNGADLNSRVEDGGTALYKAAMRGNKSIVDLLLKNGASPNKYLRKTYNPPRSPLLIATWNKSLDYGRYKSVIKLLLKHGSKDDWLSSVPGFDPYEFSHVTLSRNKKGIVMAGSMPFFLGRHYAARPSKNKSADRASGTITGTIGRGGTNFFIWENKNNKDMVTILVIEDSKGNSTSGRVMPPAFFGENGVIYRDSVNSINSGGPFVRVEINWQKKPSSGNVILKRKGKSIKLQFNKTNSTSYMLEEVSKNEPITLSFMLGDETLYKVDIDCVIRGATSDSVAYTVNQTK